MSNPNNKTVIGAFVVGAVALAVAGVLIFGGGEFFEKKIIRVMYFKGSVKGLKEGAPVMYEGVQIGSVKSITISSDPEKLGKAKIPIVVEIDPSKYRDPDLKIDPDKALAVMIEKGLRARLELQSMVTGVMQIDLAYMPGTKARLVGGKTQYPEIPTTESGLEKFTKELKDLPLKEVFRNLSATLSSIENFVDNPELKESVHNLNLTLLKAQKLVDDADNQINPLAGKAAETLGNIDKLVVDVDKVVKPFVAKIEGTADSFKATSDAARPALKNVSRAFANIADMTQKGSNERRKLDNTLEELAGAARSIKNWADYLERHPEALIRGKGGAGQRR